MSATRLKLPRGTKPGATHVVGKGGLSPEDFAKWYRDRTIEQWRALDLRAVARVAAAVEIAEREGRTVFVIGNGGSAATASHLMTDLCKTASRKGKPLVRCLSLTDNVPFITAIGNDLSFDEIFSRQLENLLRPRDVVIMITGSGNSPNLLRAADFANKKGALTIGLLGFDGGKLRRKVKLPLLVPSDQYGCVEDMHMAVGHIIAFYLKQRR